MLHITDPALIAHQLVLAHQPLARKIARGYASGSLDIDDLVSAANVGLLEAAKRFDEDRGCSFGVYAAHWAQAECRQFVRGNASILKQPKPVPGAKHDPVRAISLSPPADDERGATLELASDEATPEENLAASEDAAERSARLQDALNTLTEREREILTARQLQEKPIELKTLAERFMVSLERIRQIEIQAFAKVQKRIAKQGLAPPKMRPDYAQRLRDATLASPPKDPIDIILRHARTTSFGI